MEDLAEEIENQQCKNNHQPYSEDSVNKQDLVVISDVEVQSSTLLLMVLEAFLE